AKAEEKALLGTADAVLQCMFLGVTEGYSRKLKALYAHFPITMEVKGREVIIKNFLGEKCPRVAKIAGDTKVEAKAQLVSVSGPDKEGVGQTCANLRAAVRIREKDPRVFQDGLFEVSE
ncbi:MAG: 50S ribosomal protein L6, partial [Candidatus Micrarchaeota archaeon]